MVSTMSFMVKQDFRLCLQYINQISDHQVITGKWRDNGVLLYIITECEICTGLFGLLWCLKFENIILKSIEKFKRVSSLGAAL